MKKRLLAGLLACLTVCLLAGTALGAGKGTGRAAATATGTLGANITWTLSGTTLTVSGSGEMKECPEAAPDPWPETDEGKEMQSWFAAREKAASVVITEGITKIGKYAFYNCTRMTSLSLPLKLVCVDSFAFSGCTGLRSAAMKRDLTTIGESAFSGCTSLSSVVIPSTTTSIGANAFNRTGLRSLIIPNSVTKVGQGAFENCSGLSAIHYCGGSYDNWRTAAGDYAPANLHYATQKLEDARTCNRNLPSNWILTVTACANCDNLPAPQIEEADYVAHTPTTVPKLYATCETDGYEAYKQCAKCGTNLEVPTVIPALGHDYGTTEENPELDQDSSTAATCTKTGRNVYVKICQHKIGQNSTLCGHKETVRTETVPMLAHTPPTDSSQIDEKIIPATCQQDEMKVTSYICTVCKKPVETETPTGKTTDLNDKKVHNLNAPTYEVTTEPTCTKTGAQIKTEVCKDCNKRFSENDTIPALGHLRPTSSDEIYMKVISEPTCTKEGERRYIYQCQRADCDGTEEEHRIEEPEPIPALGHTPERVEAVPATCAEPGVLAGTKCSVCKEILSGCVKTEVDPEAHPKDKLETKETVDVEPTCTEKGSKTVTVTCKDCHKEVSTETVEIPASHKLDKTDETKRRTVPKSPDTAPTCTAPGVGIIQYKCDVCGEWVDGEETEIPALSFGEHKMGDWEIIVEPTPTADGLRERHCTNEGCGYKETDVIPAQHPAHTITLDPNGGQLAEGTTNPMTTGTDGKLTAALPAPTKEKMVFVGWFTAADGGTEVTKDTVFTENTTLYAHWAEERIYAITLNANGGQLPDGTASPVNTQPNGKLASLPTPTRDGYAFDGWYTAASGGSRASTDTVFQADTTLYAHWTEKKGFTITLDGNGGTGASASVSTGTDGRLSTMPAGPTRENFDFDGWYTEKEGGIAVTTSTVFTKDTTIYARWKAIDTTTPFAIRIGSVTNGVVSASASTATRGTKVSVLVDPNSGYAVDSVKVTASGGTAVELTKESDAKYTFTMPGSAVDVTAAFKSTGSGSGGSGGSNNNNNSGGAVWNPGAETASPNPQPVPVQLSVPQISASGQTFLDIPNSHWAAGEIAWAFQQGYMNGTGGGNFSPQAPITHSQLWTVLTRLLRYSNLSESNLLAIRQGLLDGGNPAGPATRQELVTALYRCAYLLGGARTPSVSISTFGDSRQISGYAKDAMAWAVTNGIISGTADGKLNPNGSVSRAQFAVILYRFSSRI